MEISEIDALLILTLNKDQPEKIEELGRNAVCKFYSIVVPIEDYDETYLNLIDRFLEARVKWFNKTNKSKRNILYYIPKFNTDTNVLTIKLELIQNSSFTFY